ncbi:PIN domain-containing protein [Ursidibacter arcticus]
MKYAFIDYENVNSLDGLSLQEYDRIFLFIGSSQNQMDIRLSEKFNDEIHLTLITVKDIAKNNVDFHLTYYLGKLDVTTDKNIEFHILSQDKGYDGICYFMQHQKNPRVCFRKSVESASQPIIEHTENNAEKEKINQIISEYKAFMAKTKKQNLPTKLKSLKNSIHNQSCLRPLNKAEAESILVKVINKLQQEKVLKIKDNKVSYS